LVGWRQRLVFFAVSNCRKFDIQNVAIGVMAIADYN